MLPDYLPLYRQMIRALLPRWRGSYEEAGVFIDEMRKQTRHWEPSELYARLFWVLADMEEDKDDLFKRASADWETIRNGFEQMMVRHPKSASILNGFGYMACRAGDASVYGALRDRVRAQLVPSTWSEKYSVESCDEKLK